MKKNSSLPILKIRKQGESSFAVDHCEWARSATSRMKGLLGRNGLKANEALLLDPCNQIHMLFMKFPIDACFLDREDRIIAVESLKPWRISKIYFKAKKVLELPYGISQSLGWKQGDRLEFLSENFSGGGR